MISLGRIDKAIQELCDALKGLVREQYHGGPKRCTVDHHHCPAGETKCCLKGGEHLHCDDIARGAARKACGTEGDVECTLERPCNWPGCTARRRHETAGYTRCDICGDCIANPDPAQPGYCVRHRVSFKAPFTMNVSFDKTAMGQKGREEFLEAMRKMMSVHGEIKRAPSFLVIDKGADATLAYFLHDHDGHKLRSWFGPKINDVGIECGCGSIWRFSK